MKPTQFFYLFKLGILASLFTDCNSFKAGNEARLTIGPSIIREGQATRQGDVSTSGPSGGRSDHLASSSVCYEDIGYHMQPLYSNRVWTPGQLADIQRQDGLMMLDRQDKPFILRLRGGGSKKDEREIISAECSVTSSTDDEDVTHDHDGEEKQENPLKRFIALSDNPEISPERMKRFLKKNEHEVTRVYEAPDGFTYTVLHYVAKQGMVSLTRYLVEEIKVEPDITCNKGITPLQYAAAGGHITVAEYLLGKKADINHTDNQQNSVVFCGVAGGHLDMVTYLIDQGANMDPQANTECKELNLLHIAIIRNSASYVEKLIELLQNKNVDVRAMADKKTALGDQATPLSLAAKRYGRESEVYRSLDKLTQAKKRLQPEESRAPNNRFEKPLRRGKRRAN